MRMNGRTGSRLLGEIVAGVVVGLQNRFVLQQELLVDQRLGSRSQAILLENGDLLVDEASNLHAAQCGQD